MIVAIPEKSLIVQAAAGNLKKLTLELGGQSPNIVEDDANASFFLNHGQCGQTSTAESAPQCPVHGVRMVEA